MREKLKFILILIVALLVSGKGLENYSAANVSGNWIDYASNGFTYGDGSESNPYQIDTAEELAFLAKVINEQNYMYANKYYLVTANIDLAGHSWTPIGAIIDNDSNYMGFTGVFDGGGYSISNMTITDDDDRYQLGLFGWNLGVIKNVNLKNANIELTSVREGWQLDNGMGTVLSIGGIAGYTGSNEVDMGNITNCRVQDIVIDVTATMSVSCGGLVGNVNYGLLERNEATGSVQAESGRAIWLGGLVGSIGNDTVVRKCGFEGVVVSHNNGELEFDHLVEKGYTYFHAVGGFAGDMGRANANICVEDCYAIADVKGIAENTKPYASGFAGAVGRLYGDISFQNLYCKSTVTTQVKDDIVTTTSKFVDGECGFSNQTETKSYICKGCVAIDDENYYVYSASATDSVEQKIYSTSSVELNTLLKQLGFDENVWQFIDGELPKFNTPINGLQYDEASDNWYYYVDGKIDTTYTGLVEYYGGWYYVENGVLNWNYTGLTCYYGTWYYVENGVLNWGYTGLTEYFGTWYYVENGVLNWGYTGLTCYFDTWYYVEGGVLNWSYTGLTCYYDTWYYVEGGVLNWGYTGLTCYYDTWYYVENGVLNWGYTGLTCYYGAWYYVEGGVLNWGFTGLVEYFGTWYYVGNGVLDWGFTGNVYQYGTWWYVENGILVGEVQVG